MGYILRVKDNGDWIEIPSIKGDRGPQGPQGEAFTYEDFTPEQLEALTGPQGEPGDDYVLTSQDKDEIADIVLAKIGSADTISY